MGRRHRGNFQLKQSDHPRLPAYVHQRETRPCEDRHGYSLEVRSDEGPVRRSRTAAAKSLSYRQITGKLTPLLASSNTHGEIWTLSQTRMLPAAIPPFVFPLPRRWKEPRIDLKRRASDRHPQGRSGHSETTMVQSLSAGPDGTDARLLA